MGFHLGFLFWECPYLGGLFGVLLFLGVPFWGPTFGDPLLVPQYHFGLSRLEVSILGDPSAVPIWGPRLGDSPFGGPPFRGFHLRSSFGGVSLFGFPFLGVSI